MAGAIDIDAISACFVRASRLAEMVPPGFAVDRESAFRGALVQGLGRLGEPTPDSRDVYFIRVGDFVKIGVADDVAARLATLQTASPFELQLLGVIRGVGAGGERTLHAQFASARDRGEWFRATPDLLAYIASNAEPAA